MDENWKARAERAEAVLREIRDLAGECNYALFGPDPKVILRLCEPIVGCYVSNIRQSLDEEGAHWVGAALQQAT